MAGTGTYAAARGRAPRERSPGPALTRAGGLRPLLAFLEEIGAPVQALLLEARLPPDLIDDANALIPVQFVRRFVERAASSQGIEHLGAVVASRTSAFDLAVLGPALRQAVTVYDYLQTGSRLIGQVSSGERFWLTLEFDRVRFHLQGPGPACGGRCHEDVYGLVLTIRMLRSFVGQDWSPDEVCVLATDQRVLGDPEFFGDAVLLLGQPHSSFTMPFALLQQPIRQSRREGQSIGRDRQRVAPVMPASFIESVETLVSSLLAADSLSVDIVADAAGMSTRTLQRRLRDCGRSYSDLVSHSRVRLASDWLSQTAMPVHEISAALGYTDAANFTRAFRRTTGISPQRYRQQQLS